MGGGGLFYPITQQKSHPGPRPAPRLLSGKEANPFLWDASFSGSFHLGSWSGLFWVPLGLKRAFVFLPSSALKSYLCSGLILLRDKDSPSRPLLPWREEKAKGWVEGNLRSEHLRPFQRREKPGPLTSSCPEYVCSFYLPRSKYWLKFIYQLFN